MQYPPAFKREIQMYAEALGQRTTSRLFCISQKRIFEWIMEAKGQPKSTSQKRAAALHSRRKNLSKLRKSLNFEGTNFQTPKPTLQEMDKVVDKNLQEWIQSQAPRKVAGREIRAKAKEIYQSCGRTNIACSYGWYRRFLTRTRGNEPIKNRFDEEDSVIISWLLKAYDNNQEVAYRGIQTFAQNVWEHEKPGFKASAGWALRFLKRNHLIIHWEGIYDKKFPDDLEVQVADFQSQVKVHLEPFPASNIGCMDEIPLSFPSPPIKSPGSSDELSFEISDDGKPYIIKKPSLKNCNATVILTLMKDGRMLPPMVVLKGQRSCSTEQVYAVGPVVVFCSSTTEPSKTCLEKWVELIWKRNVETPSMLVWDAYDLHSELQVDLEGAGDMRCLTIPSGCSLKLQPLNFCARKMFLDNMNKLWRDFIQPENGAEHSLETMRLPTAKEIIAWVQTSYENTRSAQNELAKSFDTVLLC